LLRVCGQQGFNLPAKDGITEASTVEKCCSRVGLTLQSQPEELIHFVKIPIHANRSIESKGTMTDRKFFFTAGPNIGVGAVETRKKGRGVAGLWKDGNSN
jgi:hypothetical protein